MHACVHIVYIHTLVWLLPIKQAVSSVDVAALDTVSLDLVST